MFKVMAEQCDQCLFSKDRIVSPQRAAEIIKECEAKEGYFICHKASIAGDQQVCCRAFYDRQKTQTVQVAHRLGLTEFVKEEEL